MELNSSFRLSATRISSMSKLAVNIIAQVPPDDSERIIGCSPIDVLLGVLSFAIAGFIFAVRSWAGNPESIAFSALNDTNQIIGSATYNVQQQNGRIVVLGHGSFTDGQRDVERDDLNAAAGAAPTLEHFEHTFFNPGGSPSIAAMADIRTGIASCSTFEDGQANERRSQIDFPTDTYAGASIMLAVQYALNGGGRTASFHVFDCAPGPEIAAVRVSSVAEHERWEHFPGELAKVEMTAKIGVADTIIGGLLPHRTAWFDPHHDWNYVGGPIQRYFAKGPQILIVREVSDKPGNLSKAKNTEIVKSGTK